MTRIILSSLLLLGLAACGNEPSGKSTTKLDAVEVQPGSISDSMIILDNVAGDGTAVDNSVPADGANKETAKPDADASNEEKAAETPATIEAPAAAKAPPAESAKKND